MFVLYGLEKIFDLKSVMICVHVAHKNISSLLDKLVLKMSSVWFLSFFIRNFRALSTKSEIALLFLSLERG